MVPVLRWLFIHQTAERFGFSEVGSALPYERVLGEEDHVEHIARSAPAAARGRSGPVGEATAHLFDTPGCRAVRVAARLRLPALCLPGASWAGAWTMMLGAVWASWGTRSYRTEVSRPVRSPRPATSSSRPGTRRDSLPCAESCTSATRSCPARTISSWRSPSATTPWKLPRSRETTPIRPGRSLEEREGGPDEARGFSHGRVSALVI